MLLLICLISVKPAPAMNIAAKETLAKNLDKVLQTMYGNCTMVPYLIPPLKVCEFSWLPGYIIKTEDFPGSRIEGAERMIASIKARKNDLLKVPNQEYIKIPESIRKAIVLKCRVRLPEQITIAEKIEGVQGKPITLKQAKQLKDLILDTTYHDGKSDNLIHTLSGEIGLIDTEMRGFGNAKLGLELFLKGNKFEEDALEYIKRECDRL
jgi:hypothetical protein